VAFVALFLLVLRRAIHGATAMERHAAVFFGTAATVIILSRLAMFGGPLSDLLGRLATLSSWFLPYWMLRLLDDFTSVRTAIKRAVLAGAALAGATQLVFPQPEPPLVLLPVLAY